MKWLFVAENTLESCNCTRWDESLSRPKLKTPSNMKIAILLIVLGILPASVLANERIAIEAKFFQTKSSAKIPHDLEKIAQSKRIGARTSHGETRAGREASLGFQRTFRLGPPVAHGFRDIATGVTVEVTPHLRRGGLSYAARVKVCAFEGWVNRKKVEDAGWNPDGCVFNTREIFTAGQTKEGEWVWLPCDSLGKGNSVAVAIRLKRKEA